MPTYEYACSACGYQWDEVQRITAPPLEVCPKCARSEAHRLISRGTNFILKGGGWYSDLYSSAKPAATPEAKSEAPAPSGDAKPAAAGSPASPAPAAPAPSTPSTST